MKIDKRKIKVLYLGTAYFLLVGFGVLFVINLALKNLIWPFFDNSIIVVSIINLGLSLFVLWLAIKIFSPIFNLQLRNYNSKQFLMVSLFLMFIAIVITSFYLFPELTNMARIIQLIYSSVLLGFFSYFSYNYIVKEK